MAYPTIKTEGGVSNAVIAPNLAQFARGTNAVLEVDFFEDAPANTTPAVPSNPAAYPSFAIVDPDGTQLAAGVGIAGATPGRWQTTWSVPTTALLSTQTNKWTVVWNMNTGTGRNLQRTNPFDIVELRTPDTLEDLRAHAYMAYGGDSERLVLRFPHAVSELVVRGYPSIGLQNPVPSSTAAFEGSLVTSTITQIQEQNLYTYIFDTPALTTFGQYQVVWQARQTISSPTERIIQKLFVPPPVFWTLAPSLKVLIDKLQKKQGSIHAYSDSDVYDYFQMGAGILNGVSPTTNWDLCTFPFNAMTTKYLIEAAALWAIKAQHIMAGELQFSFSGQTVTLDVDHTAHYSDVVDKLREDVYGDGKGAWPAAKVGLMRHSGPIAHVANRMMGKSQNQQFTYKVYSSEIGSGTQPLLSFPGPVPGVGFTLTDVLVYLNLV